MANDDQLKSSAEGSGDKIMGLSLRPRPMQLKKC